MPKNQWFQGWESEQLTRKERRLLNEKTSGVMELVLHYIVMVETEIYVFVKIHRTVYHKE